MKFADIYKSNKLAVKKTLQSMWCSNAFTDVQDGYRKQIRDLISTELFAPSNAMPLVQCMDKYESIDAGLKTTAEAIVTSNTGENLWQKCIAPKDFTPYKHQYKAWKTLLSDKKSIVVKTGTGSGKTECFMLPLVKDLCDQNISGEIQAIFLYPLNALMEDQKDRLQKLLNGTDVKFTVYNGNLPESEPKGNTDRERNQITRIIEEREKYPNIIATRDELRLNTPNIMLTNPTMLEYMMLRNKDQIFFEKTDGNGNTIKRKSLRWIVIDEAHTFTGAGAAELAMLIRRVLDAFGQDAKSVRFATSSATIGNGGDKTENENKLRKFISDIAGVDFNDVVAIDGERDKTTGKSDEDVDTCRKYLAENDYIRLDELIGNGNTSITIEERLSILDNLCERGLRAKVHFFYRIPNNGLRIKLDKHEHGVWKIEHIIPKDDDAPYLELYRCEHCGEYFAVGETVEGTNDSYKALSKGDSDIFDFDAPESNRQKLIFGLTDKMIINDDKMGDLVVDINNDKYEILQNQKSGWNIVMNTKGKCPHCHHALLGNDAKKDISDEFVELDKHASTFRVPASFISRVLAPSILPHMKVAKEDPDKKPHLGQQYISFVDSRQAAARGTMQQNLEEERLWVYSRLFYKLNKMLLELQTDRNKIEEELKILQSTKENLQNLGIETNSVDPKISELEAKLNGIPYLTWNEVYNFLINDCSKECEELCYQFINKTEGSEELDAENDCVTPEAKKKYVQTIMLELLSKRPRIASAPETMGLFTTYYPKLEDNIKSLPREVEYFNTKFKVNITVAQWKNFIKIFLDNTVRSNQSVFIKDTENYGNLDIFACQRFGTSKPPRRSVFKPTIESVDKPDSRYALCLLLLGKLIEPSANADRLRTVIFNHKDDINTVVNAMWETLKDFKLLQPSWSFKKGNWILDGDDLNPQYRLNVCDIAFKPYSTVYFCDSRMEGGMYPVMRPVDTLFMGYAPYAIDGTPLNVENSKEIWEPWPYAESDSINEQIIHEWAESKRKGLWDKGLWGETGIFSSRLDSIYSFPTIFVQAEHTAQIDKIISKQSQDKFKEQYINILACSTTMEMGVDLGNLELVMMSTIPPHPSNYKQRAGRSGRNDDNKSACITLCSSDAVGLRTLYNPLEHLISRPMATPFVDRNSMQVIQRHANAFLLRESGLLRNGNDNNLSLMVCDFFTPFVFQRDRQNQDGAHSILVHKENGERIFPNSLLKGDNDTTQTWFDHFVDYIDNNFDDYKNGLAKLLSNTYLDGDINALWSSAQKCKKSIKRCYEELYDTVSDINEAYQEEMAKADPSMVLGSAVNTGYGYLLRFKYEEILSKNLLQYLSTSRFTPNANMPVDIIEFVKNIRDNNWNDMRFKNNNPSYPLHEALSQYAPGNTIVLENRTYVVRGLQYTGMFRQNNTFKNLYSNGSITKIAVSDKYKPANLKIWSVNNKEELTLIEPTSFIPSIMEDYSREIKNAPYTQVSAQLIGVEEDWKSSADTESLISMRNNRDCGSAKILYYNEGKGYGYQFCSKCGKTVIENSPAYNSSKGLEQMHNEEDTKNGIPDRYHYMINRFSDNRTKRRKRCPKSKILRNVILGGLIQTDYCEMKIRLNSYSTWTNNKENDKLLTTLGVLFTQNFTEYIGKDRNDVDFIVMPNGHLCIYDTNPGGSGYSNQLSDRLIMLEVLKLSKQMLESSMSKDALLDKWSARYLDKIDCDTTLEWLNNALEAMNRIPDSIKELLPDQDIAVASIKGITDAIDKCTTNDSILFVVDDYTRWLYHSEQTDELGWKQRINDIRHSNKTLKLGVLGSGTIVLPVVDILDKGINDWAQVNWSDNPLSQNIIPIAYISGVLYFTNLKEYASLNYDWAKEALYQCKIDIDFNLTPIDLKAIRENVNITKFTIGANDPTKIKSNELWGLVYREETRAKNIIDSFISHCKSQKSNISIVYQDEHLKSVIGFVTTLQFIEQLTMLIGKKFKIEFKNEEYWESGVCKGIASNIGNSDLRNEMLNDMLKDWISQNTYCINAECTTTVSKELPHWRVLEVVCGDKCLAIYPNGGFVNEWFFDTVEAKNQHKYYDINNTTSATNIPLFRRKEIMYDVEIKTI